MNTSDLLYVSAFDLARKLHVNNISIKENLVEKDVKAVFLPLAERVVLMKHRIVFLSELNKEARLKPVPWTVNAKWNCVSIIPVSQAIHDDSTVDLYSPVITYDVTLLEYLHKLRLETYVHPPCVLYNGYLLDREMFEDNGYCIKFVTMPSHYSVQLSKTDLYPFKKEKIEDLVNRLNNYLSWKRGEPCYKVLAELDEYVDKLTDYTIDNQYIPNSFTFAITVVEVEPNFLVCYASEKEVRRAFPMLQHICDLIGFTDGHVQPYTLFTKHIDFPRFNVSFGKTELYSFCKQSTKDIFQICKRNNTTPQIG